MSITEKKLSGCECKDPLIIKISQFFNTIEKWAGSDRIHWSWLVKLFFALASAGIPHESLRLVILAVLNVVKWTNRLNISDGWDLLILIGSVTIHVVSIIAKRSAAKPQMDATSL
jgi:hypothetical protein